MYPDFLNELNDSQREAVLYVDGPELVIAGAGSGKTRVLTYKIAYLLTLGIKPWEILALTFTNKAAREMKERISNLVGNEQARFLHMGTFHSLFSRILRKEAGAIGYDNSFTIYDDADSKSLCKAIIKEMQLDEKVYKPNEVYNRISSAKNGLITARQYAYSRGLCERDAMDKMPLVYRIYETYTERCKTSNAMDFDDLLLNTFILFRDNEEIRMKYANGFRFFLVDEYQDTNYAQQQIIYQLASEHKKVCVVGDDAQSIYAFRGANIDNILDFQKQYDGAQLMKLERNYRSTKKIVEAANSLIFKNERQIRKNVYSEKAEGDNISVARLSSDREEAMFVCRDIKEKMKHSGLNYSDFAILYRTNSQSHTFEEQMMKLSIPYTIYGGTSFYQRKEIKDTVAYMRLVCNTSDEEALRRVINYPTRGLGTTTLNKLLDAAHRHSVSVWEVLCNPTFYQVDINKGTITKLIGFQTMIDGFRQQLMLDDAFTLGSRIIRETGISADIYSSTDPEYVSKQEHIEEFVSSMQEFVDNAQEEGNPTGLIDYLHDVALLTDKDAEDDDTEKVTLMTIHSAKGLEFPCVYVVGMEENIFPSSRSIESLRALEEERRLLYVAITRAESFCTLTYAKMRYRYGKPEFCTPSRFLRDIDRRYISIDNVSYVNESADNGYGKGYDNSRIHSYVGMQNSRPVASQFMADPKPMVTKPHQKEPAVNPYSNSFQHKMRQAGANISKVSAAMSRNTGSPMSFNLNVGDEVEHIRFGMGTILNIEGNGDSAKATVEFRNAGTKQLLLKFAKLKKI